MAPRYPNYVVVMLFTLFSSVPSFAQRALIYAAPPVDTGWYMYTSTYDFVPGMVDVRMEHIKSPVDSTLPFLVIAGVGFEGCSYDGFPNPEEEIRLAAIYDSIMQIITAITEAKHVGTFSCQCKQTDYIYVRDTTGLRKKLIVQFAAFKNYSPQIWIRDDKKWEAYRTFLYPSEEILALIYNDKKVSEFRSQGDISVKPRPVDHTLLFLKKKDRKKFIPYAIEEKFIVTGTGKIRGMKQPYYLQITRDDFIEPKHITHLTLELGKKALEMNGAYLNWNTTVVKE